MNKWLYADNGYLNFPEMVNHSATFNIVIGARRTGKTYGAFDYYLNKDDKHIYMRRTASQLDECCKEDLNPYSPFNHTVKKVGKYTGVVKDENENTRAIMLALSTISNIRGFNADAFTTIIFDEFIPEPLEVVRKGEGDAFLNAYETINSNRELQGKPPVKCWLLANSNTINNPITRALDIVNILVKMQADGREYLLLKDRDLALFLPQKSPISKRKKETALHRLARGTDFSKMAYDNEFIYDDFDDVGSLNIKQYNPICIIGNSVIYRHKSKCKYYVSRHKSGTVPMFANNERGRKEFKSEYSYLFHQYIHQNFTFESYKNKIEFLEFFE